MQTPADSLFERGDYIGASVEFERLVYSAPDNRSRTQALLGKSVCLRELNRYKDAALCLQRSDLSGLSDTLIADVRYNTALYAYLAGDFPTAESQLLQVDLFIKDSTLVFPSLYLAALVFDETQKWEKARQCLHRMIRMSQATQEVKDSLHRAVENEYDPQNYPHLKRLKKAQLLAVFLPGTGHFYLGYPGEGVISAVMVLATAAFTGYAVYLKTYFTAATVGTGLFRKFYLGGTHRMEYLTEKRNHQLLRDFNDPLKQRIPAWWKQCGGQ